MIRINLLPFRAARKRENIRVQVSLFVLSLMFAVVVMLFVHLSLVKQIKDLTATLESTKKELQNVQAAAKEVDDITSKLQILKQKTDVMTQLDTNRKDPVILFDALTELIVASRMWFTSLDSNDTAVNIAGIALDEKTIADFMARLENSPLFTNVSLANVTQINRGTQKLKSFAVTCVKAPPGEQAKPKQ